MNVAAGGRPHGIGAGADVKLVAGDDPIQKRIEHEAHHLSRAKGHEQLTMSTRESPEPDGKKTLGTHPVGHHVTPVMLQLHPRRQ